MSTPLDTLLEDLATGDAGAVELAFRTYEPYLRMVARRRLSAEARAKFDSLDVVQSAWAHALKGFNGAGWRFADAAHLRAFLAQLTRHRLIDRLRRLRRAVEHERPLDEAAHAASSAPEPADDLAAGELWERLLDQAPQAHREILHLKRAGASASEVAARTGLNEGSVRRILSGMARRLARERREDER